MSGSARTTATDCASLGLLPAAVLTLLCLTWGLGQVAVKLGLQGISPLTQAGLRSLLAIPLVLGWCGLRGITVWRRDGSLGAGLLAGLFFAGEFVAIFMGMQHTTASRSTLMVYTAPFWAVLGAHLFVSGDRLTARKLLGLSLAFAGLLLAFAEPLASAAGGASLGGDVLCLLGGMLWGATIVTIKATQLTRIAPERTLLYQLAVSALLLPLAPLLGEPGVFAPTPLVLGSLAFQVAGIAFASYLAWFWLMSRYQASALAPFLFLTPVFGVASGALLLGEALSLPLLGALALIGAGIYVVNRAPPPQA
jgi:drug/metabolite transporter (DMT)-like permease